MTSAQWSQPSVPMWPFVLVVVLFAVVIGGGALFMRRRLLAELREWVTVRWGEPRAVRELEPEDVFSPGKRSQRLWEDCGLMVDGELPTIRQSDRFNVVAWEIRQPLLSQHGLERAVKRLVSYVDSPSWRTSDGLMDVDAGAVHVGFVPV